MKRAEISRKKDTFVAPHTGAWIETWSVIEKFLNVLVAPHTGAWIETKGIKINTVQAEVAPHTGAWIETELTMKPSVMP